MFSGLVEMYKGIYNTAIWPENVTRIQGHAIIRR